MRRWFLNGVLCILLSATAGVACAPQGQRGLGVTGLTAGEDGSGIGGTGYAPSGDGRGIGGTGIIGTVTAFGSIWVNAVEVDYRDAQPVVIDGRRGTPADLRVGQVVAVEADERSGRLLARSIEVRHAVSGPVESIDTAAGELSLLGQRVRLPLGGPRDRSLRPGDRIVVSGLRDPRGLVIASRIDPAPADVPTFVRGIVESTDGDGVVVGGQRFDLPSGAGASITVGQDVLLSGEPVNGRLRVERVLAGPTEPFHGRVRNLLVEGFVEPGGGRVGGLPLPAGISGLNAGERVVVGGRWSAGRGFERTGLRISPAPRHRLQTAPRGSGPSREDRARHRGSGGTDAGRGDQPPGDRSPGIRSHPGRSRQLQQPGTLHPGPAGARHPPEGPGRGSMRPDPRAGQRGGKGPGRASGGRGGGH